MYSSRLRRVFSEISRTSPDNIIKGIQGDFNDFVSGHKINDDITLVVAQIGE